MQIVNSGILESQKSIPDIIDYLKQFEALNSYLLSIFSIMIASYSVRTIRNDSAYYDLYPYLIQKLSDEAITEKKEKLETTLYILDNMKRKEDGIHSIKIFIKIIDLVFETKYDWQRKNIREVALDKYPADIKGDTYLRIIQYMTVMKQRDENELPPKSPPPRYRHFQAQINKVNAMLEELEHPKNKVKK